MPTPGAQAGLTSLDLLVQRIRGEFDEMPGLSLTFAQACRLWQLDVDLCRRVLDTLMTQKFLARRRNGSFMALPATSHSSPAKAALGPSRQLTRHGAA